MELRNANRPEPADGSDLGTHRVLLLADESFRGRDVATELRTHIGRRSDVEILLISPAIAHTRIDHELGNVDVNLHEAGDRMVAAARELHEFGFKAEGEIGDADPLVAIDDGLARFRADEIVVVSHVAGEEDPAEEGLWERLSSDYHQPVTQLRVDPMTNGFRPEVTEVEHAPAHERTKEELIRETRNFPPMKKRAIAGVLAGMIGTIGLGLIAVAMGTQDDGQLSGSAAVVLLIAIAAFLVNVAHIVGLLFFESVRYRGFWEKFMSTTSILVTPIGLAIALVLWLA